jgi:hypothetical protein
MIKRVAVLAVSAAFLATTTTIAVVTPVEPAFAAAKEKKESTKSGLSFRERQKKCGAEWKEAKAAGKTSSLKWPKFWSDCNKRLKKEA